MRRNFPPNIKAEYFNGTFIIKANPQAARLLFQHIYDEGQQINLTVVCQMGRHTADLLAQSCKRSPEGVLNEIVDELQVMVNGGPSREPDDDSWEALREELDLDDDDDEPNPYGRK